MTAMTEDLRLAYITCADVGEADSIARALVEDRLAACCNVIPGMRSVYRWEGEICSDAEIIVIAKTRDQNMKALTEKVKELHSADVPCVLALPVVSLEGNPDFTQWLLNETGGR